MTDAEPHSLSPYGRYLYHCERGELAFQRDSSGRPLFYPRLVAQDGRTPDWDISTGLGRVHSVTVVHPRGADPFALVLVDLDEGFRMMSRIDTDAPETVTIGARVRVGFRALSDDQPVLPVFTLEVDQ